VRDSKHITTTKLSRTRRPASAKALGMRPTFDGADRALEVFVLDWDKDLRGKNLRVEFVAWIRGQEKFEGVPALVSAMARDVERVRGCLPASEIP